MSTEGTTSNDMKLAFRIIDGVTTIKGVTGAMLTDDNGALIAEDFASKDEQDWFLPLGTELLPEMSKGIGDLDVGKMDNVIVQGSSKTIRLTRKEEVWLHVYADRKVNLGMLNVEMRELDADFLELAGGAIVDERASEVVHIREVLLSEGSLDSMVAEHGEDLDGLRALQGMLWQMTNELGISKQIIGQNIEEINYRIYRESMLDIGFDFFNRKALDNYDPRLARQVLREQIKGFELMLMTVI